jgi:AcrR family transcriptional regulator
MKKQPSASEKTGRRDDAISDPSKQASRSGDVKIRQILDGARQMFLADGFDGASMNDIARAAGVSKGTLYVYFPSKVALFEALIRHDRQLQAEQLFQLGADSDDPSKVLTRIGRELMRSMCSAEQLAHLRLVIGAVARHPSIGKAFFEAGPKAGAEGLGAYFRQQVAAGRLAPMDPERAGDQFLQLCQANYFKTALFCVAEPGDDAELSRSVDEAVETFLRAYAPLEASGAH